MMANESKVTAPLNHDKDIVIAIAGNRKNTTWKNKQITISEFVEKISKTIKTTETFSDYILMSKAEQGEIKDVGGFVGARLRNSSRNKNNVIERELLTIDLDHCKEETLGILKRELGDICFSIYSTHSHTEKKPRLRLIVYPDKPLSVGEYEPVMRKIAERIGINAVDDSTYDINRLMYWGSTSLDKEYLFFHNDMPHLDVESVLSEYGDGDAWKDTRNWAFSDRELTKGSGIINSALGRVGNPEEKPGVIGAFCRVVDIRSALDILSDVYRKESDDRYSFIQGSSTHGLVVYEDKFVTSNHATDPASGDFSHNAFDIIRIHKFGDLDGDVKAKTPINKRPSHKSMVDYARDYPGVKADLIAHGISDTEEVTEDDFDCFDNDGDPNDDTKQTFFNLLKLGNRNEILTIYSNASYIVEHDEKLSGYIRTNAMTDTIEYKGNNISDANLIKIKDYITKKYNCDFSTSSINEAIANAAINNQYHPVKDYLNSLKPSSRSLVETFLIRHFGVADNTYHREIMKCWAVAAVARVFEPGFKFDNVIVLSGKQGIGKTSFIRMLAKDKWYGELNSFESQLAVEQISGCWLVEISEISVSNKHNLELQKAFLSGTSTKVRMAYARYTSDFKRSCVFMGTTNEDEYLKDSTGNRRWLPINCSAKQIDFKQLESEVDDFWSEALALYRSGETTVLSKEALEYSESVQNETLSENTDAGLIENFINSKINKNKYKIPISEPDHFDDDESYLVERTKVCTREIWVDCLGRTGSPSAADRRDIAAVLNKNLMWEKSQNQITFGARYGRQKAWVKVEMF